MTEDDLGSPWRNHILENTNTDIQEDKKRIIVTPEILYKNFKSTCVGNYNGYFFKIRESDNLYVYGNYSGEPYHFYVARITQIYNPHGMTSEHFTYYDCYFDGKREVKYVDELQSILEEYGINKEIVL